MARVKAWRIGAAGSPDFPDDFEVVKKAVLQLTDIVNNNNKYYAIELHQSGGQFRVFTHYGRTDDLENNPNAGVREGRYFASLADADANYTKIFKSKTAKSKGYKEVSLASSRIGSAQARGTSSGHVDEETLARIEAAEGAPAPVVQPSRLSKPIQDLIRYLYGAASDALVSTVQAKITANGIETPLGVLTLGQIETGQAVLDEAYELFQKGRTSRLAQLSGDFYTAIPHRLGRTRAAVEQAVIDSLIDFQQKQETLQLMRDMLKVDDAGGGNVFFKDEVDAKYDALGCEIDVVLPSDPHFAEIKKYVEDSQKKTKNVKVRHIYRLKRPNEHETFAGDVENQRLLFHGSRVKNWVGILSRGILMPKIVVSLGVNRTDAGWLGNGIYFGDAVCTTLYYTDLGKGRRTRVMAINKVALGRMRRYRKITYGLPGPPDGYQSCHGVRNTRLMKSQFEDDEYVVYRPEQQRLEYLVEYSQS